MRAVEISTPGGPDVLRVVERHTPAVAPGEALVRVVAAGVSRADALQRRGVYPPPPGASDIPGLEIAGVRADTGESVCAVLAGGGYAEFASVPRAQMLPIPDGWSFVEAASLPENMFTVYDNLVRRARLRAGDSVLVHGGSSGIGTTAIMLAKAFGAGFIAATAGSEAKCAACVELGADLAIDYTQHDFVEAVVNATSGRGVDVVFDIVGGSYLGRDLDALAIEGRIVCIATQLGAQAEISLRTLLFKRASIMGSSLRPRTVEQKGELANDLREHVWPLLPARNPIKPVVDSVFPLAQAAEAHARLESSAHIGKIVLQI